MLVNLQKNQFAMRLCFLICCASLVLNLFIFGVLDKKELYIV